MTPAAYCGEAGTTTRFVDGGQKHQRAPRIPESEWRKHKPTLKRLYENHTLSDVMTIMAHKYRFKPRHVSIYSTAMRCRLVN